MAVNSNAVGRVVILGKGDVLVVPVLKKGCQATSARSQSCLRKGRCTQETPHLPPTLNKGCCGWFLIDHL